MAATDSGGAESTPVKSSGCPFGHGASVSAAPPPATPTQPHHHPHHGPSISNVESFVVSTVPLVPGTRDGHFALADLWASFEEWSAYGVEVPLVLDEDDDGAEGDGEVFQYYVPFLSGIQIFVDAPVEDDDGARSTAPQKIDEDEDEDKTKTKVSGGFGGRTRTGETIPGRALKFQFMEQASPYSRAPLSDTVASLAASDPAVNTLRSEHLHPSSWMSVAWYPIYRIPTGRSLRDLSACFLTYHSLSTARGGNARGEWGEKSEGAGREGTGDGADGDGDPRSAAWIDAVGCPPPPPISAHGERVIRTRAEKISSGAGAAGESSRGGTAGGGGGGTSSSSISEAASTPTPLRAFGLSYYKLRGEMWHAKEVADWLAMMTDGAFSWLKRLKVIHPDFEFFSHHG
jgi:hypothetical protein